MRTSSPVKEFTLYEATQKDLKARKCVVEELLQELDEKHEFTKAQQNKFDALEEELKELNLEIYA